jgi:hypothetical protein
LLDANLDSPIHTISASGSEFGITFADIESTIHTVSSDAIAGGVITATLSNPLTDAIAEHIQIDVTIGAVIMPIATIEVNLAALTSADVIMPLATVLGVAGSNFGELTSPIATVNGSAISGRQAVGQAESDLPSVSANIYSGYIISAEINNATHDITATIDSENGITANLSQSIAETEGAIISNAFLNASVSMPSAEIVGVIAGAVNDVFTTYAMNVENAKVTQYTNFDSLAMARIGGVYLSIAKDGIYLMDGDTDNGNVIDARVRFGADDMGSDNLKRVQYSYVGSKGTVGLRMLTDSDGETIVYDATHQGNGIGTRRIKLGKGAKSRYWQPEITGNCFELDSISLEAEVLSRRVA